MRKLLDRKCMDCGKVSTEYELRLSSRTVVAWKCVHCNGRPGNIVKKEKK